MTENHGPQNEPVTRGTLLRATTDTLAAAGVAEPRRKVIWLLCHVLQCSTAHLVAYPNSPVLREHVQALLPLVARLARREPLQYVLGYTDFCGLRLCVSPDVLIPRPETEQVVDKALGLISGVYCPQVLDIGTGSGCIALAVKRAVAEATVLGIDVSEAALVVAQANAEKHGLEVEFLCTDVLADDFVRRVLGPFDLIVSNPPYLSDDEAESLDTEIRNHEPELALFAGADPLLHFRVIASYAIGRLTKVGYLVFEAHAYRADEVRGILEEFGFRGVTVAPDLAGHPRIVHAGPSRLSRQAGAILRADILGLVAGRGTFPTEGQ